MCLWDLPHLTATTVFLNPESFTYHSIFKGLKIYYSSALYMDRYYCQIRVVMYSEENFNYQITIE
jgi:hypothetical protein